MIQVACAILVDKHGKVFAAQRSAVMSQPLKWEFPGGKLEEDESAEAALQREIAEELGVQIVITKALQPNIFVSEKLSIRLIPFIAEIIAGNIYLKEHQDGRWCSQEELEDLDWSLADIPVLHQYLHLVK